MDRLIALVALRVRLELRALAGQCKFRDCAHQGEPDCALRAAVEAGTIYEDRLDSYFQILDSL